MLHSVKALPSVKAGVFPSMKGLHSVNAGVSALRQAFHSVKASAAFGKGVAFM